MAYLEIFASSTNYSLDILDTRHGLYIVHDCGECILASNERFIAIPFAAPLSRNGVEVNITDNRFHVNLLVMEEY